MLQGEQPLDRMKNFILPPSLDVSLRMAFKDAHR